MFKTTVAEYLIMRLQEFGCQHVFGIPGTSCAGFFEAIGKVRDIEYILTSNELEAGYMADGYGRQGKIGAVCVSYGVGTLSIANAVASALTEHVPLIVINGGPKPLDIEHEERYGVLFSHSTGRSCTDFEVMKHLCVDALIVRDDDDVEQAIDQLFRSAIVKKGPVYFEIAQDQWNKNIEFKCNPLRLQTQSNSTALKEVLGQIQSFLSSAKKPVVIVGTEIEQLGLQEGLKTWLKQHQLPFVTTLLSKANVYVESSEFFGGVYDSDLAPKYVRTLVEEADFVLGLGVILGIDHLAMVSKQINNLITVAFGEGRIPGSKLSDVYTNDIVVSLPNLLEQSHVFEIPQFLKKKYRERRESLGVRYISDRVSTFGFESIFDSLNIQLSLIEEHFLLAIDTCLASYPAADLFIPEHARYLANPVWLSIGHATPAGVGAYFANGYRPIIITGDGGFQMVVQAVSTMARYKVPAIIIILDNGTYAIEQFLIKGEYFLDDTLSPLEYTTLNQWQYDRLVDVFGGVGYSVKTESTFVRAFKEAITLKDQPVIISAKVGSRDLPAENKHYLENQ